MFHCSLVQYCSYSDHEQCHTLHHVDTDIDADNQIQTSHIDKLAKNSKAKRKGNSKIFSSPMYHLVKGRWEPDSAKEREREREGVKSCLELTGNYNWKHELEEDTHYCLCQDFRSYEERKGYQW